LIGQNRIAVPTHYFKVILGETRNDQLELQVGLSSVTSR